MRDHGDKVIQALLTELMQLEDEDVLIAVDSTKLTRQQKQKALKSLSFFK